MTAIQLRQKYIDFFKAKGHKQIPSASLIPENDPTVLFTTAGMHPLVPYLLGQPHPLGRRLVNSQKCIRTGDIDEVGDNTHLTFFEMLGNWSLGDYFKKEAIEWSFEFLTAKEWLGLDIRKLAVSVFTGDTDAPRDDESARIWQSLGIPKERIAYLGKTDNWWGPAGQTGPCGPDTEMFYWVSDEPAPREFDTNDKRWVEIWNDVFMEYEKNVKCQMPARLAGGSNVKSTSKMLNLNNKQSEQYEYILLKQKNVDTGMGLERIAAIMQGVRSVYETDLFKPIIDNVKCQILNVKTKSQISNLGEREIRIVADHIKAVVFIIADGVEPSNIDRGYVVRKLIRRAMRYQNDLIPAAQEVIKIYKDIYPELEQNQEFIYKQIILEGYKFRKILHKATTSTTIVSAPTITTTTTSSSNSSSTTTITPDSTELYNERIGEQLFQLYTSHGLPIEIAIGELKKKGENINDQIIKIYNEKIKKHQELSRTAAAGRFKAGLADNQEKTVRLHTATHLLLSALRQVLGRYVKQAGSNITPERLRFDFTHSGKMTPEQIAQVEKIVNEKIQAGLSVSYTEMTLEQAKKQGVLAAFKARYPEKVKVYSIGDFSREICSGPHAQNINELDKFKIIKEEASSAGVRRIKAVLK